MMMGSIGLAVGTATLVIALSHGPESAGIEISHTNASHLVHREQDSVGLCPWRNPDRDRLEFFPTSTGVREETLILSRKRPEVARQLGRPTTGEENALKVYRIVRQDQILGSVVARRVRGESGVIELLLAVGVDGNIVGARLQRLREPDDVAQCLQSTLWLGAFVGKNRTSAWHLGGAVPDVMPTARTSATAILDAARTLLILLAVADGSPGSAGAAP